MSQWARWALWILLLSGAAGAQPAFENIQPYWLVCGEERSQQPLVSLFVLPGEKGQCRVEGAPPGARFELLGQGLRIPERRHVWEWTAPAQPGHVPWILRRLDKAGAIRIQLWVLTPASKVRNGSLKGFRIGTYPDAEAERGPLYRPPRGYVEVTADNAETLVSPNYRLKQFVSKQNGGYPKFLILRTRLLEKLEWLNAAAQRDGLAKEPFVIMSGFRTPHYNQLLSNRPLSRHLWGGAADLYIDDSPRDGHMDDLNKDGRVDTEDARFFAAWVEDQAKSAEYQSRFVGGMGVYGANSAHGPFVHLDVRGVAARW